MKTRKTRVAAQYATIRDAVRYAHTHESDTRDGRFLRERIRVVHEILASLPGGLLLDAGCGPGILARSLLESARHHFAISVLDRSPAMVAQACADGTPVHACVGELEAMPYSDGVFDVTVVTGALEYCDISLAVGEIARVTRPGGTVLVSMLNPLSPHRIAHMREARANGIQALTSPSLRALMAGAGLRPSSPVYFQPVPDIRPMIRWLATGYIVTARKES